MEMTRRGLFGMVAGVAAGRAVSLRKIEPEPVKIPDGYVRVEAVMEPFEKDGSRLYKATGVKIVNIHIDGREVARTAIKYMPGKVRLTGLR